MAQEELDSLLARMDSIAKSVNSFTSESVQQEVFAALIAAFEGKHHTTKANRPTQLDSPAVHETTDELRPPSVAKSATKQRKATKTKTAEWTLVKELDLHPSGKKSFQDFVKEKNPKSNEEKYTVAIYYLSETLGISQIKLDHVGTLFRLEKSWKEPRGLSSGLRMTAFRKGTIDTGDSDSIKITPTGRNLVEHDLPGKEKGSK